MLAHEPDGHGGLFAVRLDERGFDVDTHPAGPGLRAEVERYEARNIGQCDALVEWYLDEVAFPGEGTARQSDGEVASNG